MNENPINLTKWTDTELSGTIHSDGYKTMFTSIPYDKGWKLFVDGVETETRPVLIHLLQQTWQKETMKFPLPMSRKV
mgnify:CR=1 FL=1